ncbi:MAG: hypothetical protein MN733_06160, partial [Nitrososphaera sp.]|nr:hypothetical protein [Nitrososphaera sp.]
MFRAGQMGQVGAGVIQGILPDVTQMDVSQVFQRSKLDEMLFSQTDYGKETYKMIQESAPPEFKDPRMFVHQQQRALAGGRRGTGLRIALTKLMGVQKYFEGAGPDQQMEAYSMLEKMGLGVPQAAASVQMMQELTKRAGERGLDANDPQVLAKMLKQYMHEAQSDPAMQQRIKEAGLNRDMKDAAEEQGRAMLSAMEKTADLMTDVRLWAHEYWNNWRNATAEMFGINRNAPWYEIIGKAARAAAPASGMGAPEAAAFGPKWQAGGGHFGNPANRLAQAPTGPTIRTENMTLSRDAARSMENELHTRGDRVSPD